MSNLKTEDVSALLELLKDSGFDELHVETDEFEIYIARRGASSRKLVRVASPSASEPVLPPDRTEVPVLPPVANRSGEKIDAPPQARAAQNGAGAQQITAPLMGTFYRAPSPGAPPFVEVGQEVTPETTIAIIEVMKLMNQIPAGVSGVIEKIFIENGALVEFGQPLMLVVPKSGQ